MNILYKILLFMTLFYLVSAFVHVLHIFPETPFSDIETTDPVVYNMLIGGGGLNQSRSILDLFFYYDVDLSGLQLGNYRITSLSLITLCLGIGLLAFVALGADNIRIIITSLVFGAFLAMLNSSFTFMIKILGTGGGAAMSVLIMVIGVAILFIVVFTFFDKVTQSGGGAED